MDSFPHNKIFFTSDLYAASVEEDITVFSIYITALLY